MPPSLNPFVAQRRFEKDFANPLRSGVVNLSGVALRALSPVAEPLLTFKYCRRSLT